MGIQLVREIEASLGNRQQFKLALSDYLRQVRDDSLPRQRPGFISPSQVGGCKQWALMQVRGYEGVNNMSPWKIPYFEVAHAIHRIYQNLGVQAGIISKASIEQWVEFPELFIGGQIDAQVVDDGPIVDFKTVNTHRFNRVVNENRPLKGHYTQQHCYMLAKGQRETIMVYVRREEPDQLKEVRMFWDDAVGDRVKRWCGDVVERYRAGIDFPELFKQSDCKGCRFYEDNLKTFTREALNERLRIAS